MFDTNMGLLWNQKLEDFIASEDYQLRLGKVQLILTSPPFALNSPKEYGNLKGKEFVSWLSDFAEPLSKLLTPNGSIVVELGNNWVKGVPCISLTPMVALMNFLGKGKLNLCQEFIVFNKTRLPLPTKWVCVEKIRCKDQFNKAWWMSPTTHPKTRIENVRVPYAETTKQQIKDASKYTDKAVPSGHIFKRSSMQDNGGALPSSVLTLPHTKSSGDKYLQYCKDDGLTPHPARMQESLVEFFIKFLTDPGDIVFDPFAGSNTTGYVAEKLNRKWMSVEMSEEYCKGSIGRWKK